MTTITLEVPDDLAGRLSADPARLTALLREAVEGRLADPVRADARPAPLCREVLDFLAAGPTLDELAAFKISGAAQGRLEELLDRNREGELPPEGRAELEQYLRYRHMAMLLKSSARRALAARRNQPEP